MASPAWLARRRAWRAHWVTAHGAEPTCAICGAAWNLRSGDLHHRSYARLGAEADLVAVCRRPCHEALHRVESNPAWAAVGRAQASDVIIARLRARRQGSGG